MKQFENKVALVTGGGSGIGRATALAYAEHGAKVVVAGRRAEKLHETVHAIQKIGGSATAVPTDMTDEGQVKTLMNQVIQTYGRLDFALNNAGIEGTFGRLTDLDSAAYDEIMNANLKTTWLSLKYEIPVIQKPGGVIINVASAAAHVGIANLGIYSASKAGVVGLTRNAAIEFAQAGIRVNVISPGPIETPMTERMFGSIEALHTNMGATLPLSRAGKPEEIASAAVWLSSEGGAFITGQVINIDGGLTAQ